MVFPQNPATTDMPKYKSPLSGAAKKSPLASPVQIALMEQGVPRGTAYATSEQIAAQNAMPATPMPPQERTGPIADQLSRSQPGISSPQELRNPGSVPFGVPSMAATRPQMGLGAPGTAGGDPMMRGPRSAPGMDVPGAIVTPEGTLADIVSTMSMQPDPAYVQEQTELARALGQQRYDQSDVARMQSGRMADMTANRNMGQMAGGNYADMDPARAAAAAQGMYRGGGLGGASMGAREDAIEQALRARGPSGPSQSERIAGSRQEMNSMLAEALQGQGGAMNPQAGFEQNARMLQPGTTLTGTDANGTPMIISRGSAGTLDDRTRDARQEQYRTARRERAGELRGFRQNQNAMRNEAMVAAASNPANSPFMRALMANDPRGAAAIMQAQGGLQLGSAELAQKAEADRQRFQNDTEKLRQAGIVSEAEARRLNAQADGVTAETGVLTAASTPEAQAAAQRNAERMTALQGGMAPPTYTDGLFEDPAARSSATAPPQSVSQALRRVEQTAPAVDRLAGSGVSAGMPSGYANAIDKRIESGAMYSDSDLQSMQANYQARALSDPNFKPNDGGLLVASGAIPSENTMFQQMLHERMVQPQPITADEVIQLRKKAKESNAAAKRESMANNRTESLPNNNYDTGRFVGMP
jgi:hypothetical protein